MAQPARHTIRTDDPLHGLELRPAGPGKYLLTLFSPYMQTRDRVYFDLVGDLADLAGPTEARVAKETLACHLKVEAEVITARFTGANPIVLALNGQDLRKAAEKMTSEQ